MRLRRLSTGSGSGSAAACRRCGCGGSVRDLVLVVLQHVVGAAAEAQARVVDDLGHVGGRLPLAGRGGEPVPEKGEAEGGLWRVEEEAG